MSIQKRDTAAGVRYVARYRGPDKKQRSKVFTRHKDAKAWVDDLKRELRRGEWIDPAEQELTFADLMDAHTNRATNKRTRQVRKFAADNLGRHNDVPIASLRPSLVRDLLDDAAARELAPSSVKQILATVKAALNTAVKDGILLRSPAENVGAPRVDPDTVTGSSLIAAEQIARIRDHASQAAGLAILIGAATGLRGGEVAGLKVSSVDFLRSTVHVTHQATGRAKPWTWEPLKSARSRREVPLPLSVRDELSRSLIGRDDPDAPLILTRTGGEWSSVTLGEAFKNAADAATVGGFTFHDLRHFYASVLISRGVSVQGSRIFFDTSRA